MSRAAGQLPPLRIPVWIRYFDLIVLVAVLPLFLFAGLPMAGYIVGGGAWIVQRAIQVTLYRRARAAGDVRIAAGVTAASMIGRGWLCAGAIFAVGLAAGDDAGLSAALLVIGLFTVYFTVNMITRPMERGQGGAR
jgi:hypothetical protein